MNRFHSSLLERESSISLLLDQLGSGRIVQVLGEPGVGKTRMVEEALARLDGVRVINATCPARPMSAFEVFSRLRGQLPPLKNEDDLPQTIKRLGIPLVWVIDHAQYADGPSLRLLARSGATLIVTAPTLLSLGGTVIRLQTLGPDAVGRMLASCLGKEPPSDFQRIVLAATHGNPSRIQHFCHWLLETGRMTRRSGRWIIPSEVRPPADLIHARLAVMPSELRPLAEGLSLLGEPRKDEAEVLGMAPKDFPQFIAQMKEAGWLSGDWRWDSTAREAIAASIQQTQRERWHWRIARHSTGLEAGFHLLSSHEPGGAVVPLRQAAADLIEAHCLAEAAPLLETALGLLPDDSPTRLEIQAYLGIALTDLEPERARELLLEALDTLPDSPPAETKGLLATIQRWWKPEQPLPKLDPARLRRALIGAHIAAGECESALALTDQGSIDLDYRLLRARAHLEAGRLEDAFFEARQAMTFSGSDSWQALWLAGLAALWSGDLPGGPMAEGPNAYAVHEALLALQEGRHKGRAPEDPPGASLISEFQRWRDVCAGLGAMAKADKAGLQESAAALCERTDRLSRDAAALFEALSHAPDHIDIEALGKTLRTGSALLISPMVACIEAHLAAGGPSEAAEGLVLRHRRELTGGPVEHAAIGRLRGRILELRGESADALNDYTESVDIAVSVDDRHQEALSRMARARLNLRLGNYGAARTDLEAAVEFLEATRPGQAQEAKQALDEALAALSRAMTTEVPRETPPEPDWTPPRDSLVDPMTGLFTQDYFLDHLGREFSESKRYGHPLSVMMLSVDRLADHGDMHEDILRSVADMMRRRLRDHDVPAHYGSERLALLLPHTDQDGALFVAERIRRAVAAQAFGERRLTASIGIAQCRPSDRDPALFLERVARAMHAAQYAGGNRIKRSDERDTPAIYELRKLRFLRQESYANAVKALTETLKVKDGFSHEHCLEVSRLASRLGEAMGLAGSEVEELGLAGLVHDLGKVGIPDSILTKLEPLTDSEALALRAHPELGYQILKAGSLHRVAPAVLHHHERWDGQGYPSRLSGEGIPLMARIIAVADAYCDMAGDRPYRKGSMARALEEIQLGSGTQFDPAVVDALMRL